MPQHHHHSLADDATLAVGATGAVVAADQLLKLTDEDDKSASLLKAGVGAAVAIGAWELLRRAEANGEPLRHRTSRSYSRSRSRSRGGEGEKEVKHHKTHLMEEIIGAYSLGRKILGDRRHHVAHLVGEALGATGLIQELGAKDKLNEEERGEQHRRRRREARLGKVGVVVKAHSWRKGRT